MQFRPIDVAIAGALALAIALPRESPEVLPLMAFDSHTRFDVGLAEQRLVRGLSRRAAAAASPVRAMPGGGTPSNVAAPTDDLAATDDLVALAIELADRYTDAGHPELALSALAEVERRAPEAQSDWRLSLAAAGCLAELLVLEPALWAMDQALESCRSNRDCTAATRTKAGVFRKTLASVVELGIDAHREPARLRAALGLAMPRTRMRPPRPLNKLK